jgi:hypothetical protein
MCSWAWCENGGPGGYGSGDDRQVSLLSWMVMGVTVGRGGEG